MNGKTIRQSLVILALGFVVVTAGCSDISTTPQTWAGNGIRYQAGKLAQKTRTTSGAMVDVSSIDRALTYNEIRGQYNQATADEFVAQGLNR